MDVWLITIPEVIGLVAFAASGALVAINKKLDLFGIACLGIVAALGGGVIRDILLGNFPPVMFRNYEYALIALLVSILLFFLFRKKRIKLLDPNHLFFKKTLDVLDTIGLAVFTIIGMNVAFASDYGDNGFLVMFVGVLTGIGGGVLRDVLVGEIPFVLQKQIYATASIIGALSYYVLTKMEIVHHISILVSMMIVAFIRLLSIRYRWRLPRAE